MHDDVRVGLLYYGVLLCDLEIGFEACSVSAVCVIAVRALPLGRSAAARPLHELLLGANAGHLCAWVGK